MNREGQELARFSVLARALAAVPVLLLPIVLAAGAAVAEPSHAIAMLGVPKYPANFSNFDYVNPDPRVFDRQYRIDWGRLIRWMSLCRYQ